MDEGGMVFADRGPVRRVALASLLAACGLVALKLAAALTTGSLALLSEAAHSGLDAVVTGLTLFAVSVAARPPDADHPYGHGKAENVAAMIESVALLILSIAIAREAVLRLAHPGHAVRTPLYAFGVIGASIVVDASRVRVLSRAGKRDSSPALQADALHFTADLLTPVAGLARLAAVKLGHRHAHALEVAHTLTEQVEQAIRWVEPGADVVVHVEPLADEKILAEQVLSIAARHPGVHQVHNVFVARRPDGLNISLHAKFPGSMPLVEAHSIAEGLEADIAREITDVARVDTHLEPLEGATTGADVTAQRRELVASVTALAENHPEVRNRHEA